MTAPAKITPCLWFDFNAEEAVNYYLSIFKNGRVLEVSHYGDAVPSQKGKVLTMRFEIEGQPLLALNAGPQFPFTEAISLLINCEDQEEVDRLWTALTAGGGQEGDCGWLKDRYGLSWQVTPAALIRAINAPDQKKVDRVMAVMMEMKKINVARIEAAARAG